jgi:2-haloacid dehalogenase
MYTWLLFDADNTLFDYTKAEDSALGETFNSFSYKYHSGILERYQQINHQMWEKFEQGQIAAADLRWKRFQILLDEIGIKLDSEKFSNRYLKGLAKAVDLIPGAMKALEILADQYHMALVTNGLSDVQHSRLKLSGIGSFFEKIFISEELGAPKPEIRFFDAVFREIGNPPKNCVLIIGDSLSSDIRGGIQYGIDTCWFNPRGDISNLPVTFEIDSYEKLIELLTG